MKKQTLGLLFITAGFLFPMTSWAQTQQGETTITADITSTYTMTIPAQTKQIVMNTELTELGPLKIDGNLDPAKLIKVEATKTDLTNQANAAQKIPFLLVDSSNTPWASATWNADEADAKQEIPLQVKIDQSAWKAAKPGKYKGSIVFTSSIIDKE